jgi:uncharacterized protein (TIGR03066 family)
MFARYLASPFALPTFVSYPSPDGSFPRTVSKNSRALGGSMKTKLACVVVACLVLSVAGCGSDPKSRIVGKWEAGQGGVKLQAEFTKDGKATLTIFGKSVQGTYKVNGDELETTINGTTTKSKMKVTATELELTNDGKTITYKKL